MSNQIPISMVGESIFNRPTVADSELALICQNQSWQFTPQPTEVYLLPPPQLPAQMWYEPQSMSAAGDVSPQLQMPPQMVQMPPQMVQLPPQMVQTPGPSQLMPTSKGKGKADETASGSEKKRGCVTHKACDLINALSLFLPCPPKEDAASTLGDVIDYIMLTQWEIQQLQEKLSGLYQATAGMQYQATAGMQYQATAAEGYKIPYSPINGLVQMPNQMVGTDVVPAIGFPVNQAADNQAADAAAGVNQAAAVVNQPTVVNQDADAAVVVNQAADAAAIGLPETIQEVFEFGELNDIFFIPSSDWDTAF